jgi:hypothetical protein
MDMDPNQTLAFLLKWASAVCDEDAAPSREWEAAERFLALHEWVMKSSFVPAPWAQALAKAGQTETAARRAAAAESDY